MALSLFFVILLLPLVFALPAGPLCCARLNRALQHFKIDAHTDLEILNYTFNRPENVLITKENQHEILYASERTGRIQRVNLNTHNVSFIGSGLGLPNGLAEDSLKNIVVCNAFALALGASYNGTMWKVNTITHNQDVFLWKLGSAFNHIHMTRKWGRDLYWIAVTTQGTGPADGYVAVADNFGTFKILATNLIAANEVNVQGDYLYVIETRGFCVRRFKINYGAWGNTNEISLSNSEIYAYFGYGVYLDGMKFDQCGNLWVTLVHKHGIAVVSPSREINVVFEDPIPEFDTRVRELLNGTRSVANVETDFANPTAGFEFPTSVAFAGPNLETMYIASLFPRVARITLPVDGEPLLHNQ